MASAPPSLPVPSWLPAWPLLVLAAFLFSLGIAVRLARPEGRWGRFLRRRFVLGVPWGTLLTVVGVAAVYLFVQGGWAHPKNPLVVPFRAWSYLYPLGVLAAPFSHSGLNHVTGNLLGTLTFAPIVEFAWGHFPTGRGRQSFGSLRDNPFARILAFPLGVFVVGLLTGLFALGPVIGFSGVVFAFAGFALVYYPIPTVVALAAGQVLSLVYSAVQNPVSVSRASSRFVTPWWANIAIQGHALGLFLGVLAGGLFAARRDRRPSPGELWLATLVFAVSRSLWALYWYRGGVTFVLFRAAGVVAVFLLAALVTAALTASDETLVGTLSFRRFEVPVDIDRREAAVGLFVALTVAVGAVAVPVNLATVGGADFDADVQVRDYTISYAENVEDQYVSVFDISAFGETTQVNTSGVIVVSERRSVFITDISKQRLAFNGRGTVVVGGVGWRREVGVDRRAWNAVGNGSAYTVFLDPPDGRRTLAYTSDPVTVEPRIEGRRIRIEPARQAFDLVVRRDDRTLGRTRLPTAGNDVDAGGLRFNRTNGAVYAIRDGTRVRIANEGGKNGNRGNG